MRHLSFISKSPEGSEHNRGDTMVATQRRYYDILIFCEDALLTRRINIGPAVVMPCPILSTQCLADQVKQFCDTLNIYVPSSNVIKEQFDSQSDKLNPSFVIAFPKLPIWEMDRLVSYLKAEMKAILGVIALNRMAYPKEIAIAYFKRENDDVTGRFILTRSYYRGNLLGGAISGEDEEKWNYHYNCIKSDNRKAEIIFHYKSANAETDLDYAYLRYWSLLEAITKQLIGKPILKNVRHLIIEAYKNRSIPASAEELSLTVGSEKFDFFQLTKMWYEFRNYTAHEGGFFVRIITDPRIGKEATRLMSAMEQEEIPFVYGEEKSLFTLKDIVDTVINYYLIQ